jgi:hypothetical protein
MSILTGKILLTMSAFGMAWRVFPEWSNGIAIALLVVLWWIVKLHLKRHQTRRLSR